MSFSGLTIAGAGLAGLAAAVAAREAGLAVRVVDGEAMFGVESGGEFFAMADAKQVRDAL